MFLTTFCHTGNVIFVIKLVIYKKRDKKYRSIKDIVMGYKISYLLASILLMECEKEWTGGTESYSLTEKNGVTTLIVKTDVPQEQEETFNTMFPRALERIKTLAEKMQ